MKDVANACGISVATVSKILNGKDGNISEDTRQLVLNTIKEMGYVQNAVAKGLRTQRTNTLGFILPDIRNPFFAEIARGIEDCARRHNYNVLIANTNGDAEVEYGNFKSLTARMVDGIVFTRTLKRQYLSEYSKMGLPIVIVDREIDIRNTGFGSVTVDTQHGVYDATRILIEKGCHSIAFISAQYTSDHDRYEGYRHALQENGFPCRDELVYRSDYTIVTGYEGMLKILDDTSVDGVVCGNDLIAVGVYKALREKGLSIPEDIKVFGFDDIYFSKLITPPLTTIRQPAYEMGEKAAQMLIGRIEGVESLRSVELPYRIVMRDSV